MRVSIWLLSVLLGVFLLHNSAPAQENFDTVQIRTQQVAEGVYMLTGSGGNIGVSVGEDAVFVVDDQFAPLTPKILGAIAQLTNRPVRFVLNTHWHFDHTGGNEEMGKAGALLVAHDNVRRRMSTDQAIEFFNMKFPAAPKGALPVVTFSDTVTFHINGDEVRAFHVAAAHTDGDAFIYWRRANVVHAGDVFVRYGFPFIDVAAGGTIDGIIAATDVLLSIGDENVKLIPGHGELADRAAVRAYRAVLATVRDRVRQQKNGGRTLAQVIATKPTAEFDAQWGKGLLRPEQFVELVYRSLPEPRR